MVRSKERDENPAPASISIIGPGMRVFGDCVTDGTLRVEGTVHGTIYADRSVVVARDGSVNGGVHTQEAVILGEVTGTLVAASKLEVQKGARIAGEIRARRMELADGAFLNGEVAMDESIELGTPPIESRRSVQPKPESDRVGATRPDPRRKDVSTVRSGDAGQRDGHDGAEVKGVGAV